MAEKKKRKQGYGWVPDIPDNRDFMFRKVYRIPATLPSSSGPAATVLAGGGSGAARQLHGERAGRGAGVP